MPWKPVYYSKNTEEERSTLTKTYETFTKIDISPETYYAAYPIKGNESLSDRENWHSSGSSVVNVVKTVTVREPIIDYSDQFFQRLFNQTDEIHHAKPARVIPKNSLNQYRDWQTIKDKLFKEFENVGENIEKHVKIPKTIPDHLQPCFVKQPVRQVNYPEIVSSLEKCKQQENKMRDKLKEIHAMVEDVKNLSEKFPKLFQNKNPAVKMEHTLRDCPTRQNDITYISGITLKINPRKFLN